MTKKKQTLFAIAILHLIIYAAILSCNHTKEQATLLYDLDSNVVNEQQLFSKPINVFYFFSPECPICLGYTLTLQHIDSAFIHKDINFVMVIPSAYIELPVIKMFVNDYHIPCKVYADDNHAFIKKMKAQVTPQVVVANAKGKILYSGLIDDYAEAPGITRQQITKHYLQDVLHQLLAGQPISQSHTTPKGCFIEFE